ncbi:hypothetical protein AB9F26_09280 [Falsihalocynthiibacter sp. BN13B15]|uniref:hypothetical protein n=1 Tax=Falsihalocynthiibacter sp. BN13B15 TaxID=3240871 RepID=UPI00350F34D3
MDRRIAQVFEGRLAEPRAPKEFGKPEMPLDDKDRRFIRVPSSEVGFRMYSRRICEIDAGRLCEHLIKCNETAGTKAAYEWSTIELWLRRSIESKGLTPKKACRIRMLQEWYTHQDSSEIEEPPEKRCREILDSLYTEYGYVEKTPLIRL